MGTPRHSDEQRREIVELYISRGGDYAESESGVKRSTIRQWANRLGIPLSQERARACETATEAAHMEWALRRATLANEFGTLAATVVEKAKAAARANQPANVRAWVAAGTQAVQNAQLLTGSATSRTENVETVRNEAAQVMQELEAQMRGPAR